MLGIVTHILPLTYIRRARLLPVAGQVLVRSGQRVSSSDTVAQASLPSKHLVLDIRSGLGLARASDAAQYIIRHEGDVLTKGDVIAQTNGLIARMVRAPADGEIRTISGGKVALRVQVTALEIKAGFSGIVTEIIPERGAMIETNGMLLQGAWGNGKIDNGMLEVLAKSPEDVLTRDKLEVSLRGSVVLAGHCASADVLQSAAELPLRGLILASMSSDLVDLAGKMEYPIFLLEGFGKIPMNSRAYSLLSNSEKRDTSVNATFAPSTGERPEIIIPVPSNGDPAPETDEFRPNQTVRIQGKPYNGIIGKLIRVHPGLATLPNGVRAYAADIQVDMDTRVVIPLTNLEIIE